MPFELSKFSQPVQVILAKYTDRLLPLVHSGICDANQVEAIQTYKSVDLFPSARFAEEARSGLLLLLDCWDESHRVSQDLATAEGFYWHGIAHRMEPDDFNAAYWFRRVKGHAIFPKLHESALLVLTSENITEWRLKKDWDPFLFIEWCADARKAPGSAKETAALRIQKIEWELLFDWCANVPGKPTL